MKKAMYLLLCGAYSSCCITSAEAASAFLTNLKDQLKVSGQSIANAVKTSTKDTINVMSTAGAGALSAVDQSARLYANQSANSTKAALDSAVNKSKVITEEAKIKADTLKYELQQATNDKKAELSVKYEQARGELLADAKRYAEAAQAEVLTSENEEIIARKEYELSIAHAEDAATRMKKSEQLNTATYNLSVAKSKYNSAIAYMETINKEYNIQSITPPIAVQNQVLTRVGR